MSKIIVGISGGIAAYKSCELVRLLIKAKHQVKVVMSEHAKQFINPNTFAALSQNPVYDDLFKSTDGLITHTSLAKWCDLIIIAPTTAKTLASLAHGYADNLLTNICLATTAPCYLAPAMNKIMWEKAVTQANINLVQNYGYQVLNPGEGEQACGDFGEGRMMEAYDIFQYILPHSQLLAGIKIVITAGPTQEKIDPVRYLSNYSSGKMGFALAESCQRMGADVHLIAGPTQLLPPVGCSITQVISTQEMLNAAILATKNANIFISAAAISDYSCENKSTHKIKKSSATLTLTLKQNPDIIKNITTLYPKVFAIGFCAETEKMIEHAKAKIKRKNLNAIIANQINENGYPFNYDTNQVTYIDKSKTIPFVEQSKSSLADNLMKQIYTDFKQLSSNKIITKKVETD